MARIRSIKPEFPQSESMGRVSRDARGHFIKKAIPVGARRELARENGCQPSSSISAACAKCGAVGTITWFPGVRGDGWVHFQDMEIDHILPEFMGGETSVKNLQLLCMPCNRSKGFKHGR